jgi:4-hydroxy 2-oxovalerate aldolase
MANSFTAAISGCQTIDASILGMGAGAGNTPLEVLAPAFDLAKFDSGINLSSVLRLARYSRTNLHFVQPRRGDLEVATALSNLFSGYSPVIQAAAERYNVDPLDVAYACLGKKLVAGQEDLVLRVAEELSH